MKWRFVRFSLVGAACYCAGIVFLYLGTEKLGLHYLVSMAIALVLVNILGWLLNRRWTFSPSGSSPLTEFCRYFVANISGFFLTMFLMAILVSWLGVNYLLASALIAAGMMFVNFFVHRYWSFAGQR